MEIWFPSDASLLNNERYICVNFIVDDTVSFMIVHQKFIMTSVFFLLYDERGGRERRRGECSHTHPGRLIVRDCLRKDENIGTLFRFEGHTQ